METNYVSFPLGKISKQQLKPWFQWIEKQNCEFTSYPEIVKYYKETAGTTKNIIDSYLSNALLDEGSFVKDSVLFYVYLRMYELPETNISMLVQFFADGNVEINEIYYDDGEVNSLIEENIKNINVILNEKQEKSKLTWEEFIKFYEEIMSGIYSKKLAIPEFWFLTTKVSCCFNSSLFL